MGDNFPLEVLPLHWLIPAMVAIVLGRYFLVAGTFYFVFYLLKRKAWQSKRIQKPFPTQSQIHLEMRYSTLTSIIFGVSGALLLLAWKEGHTSVYLEPARYGYAYLPISFFGAMLLHETYFYWTHRMMHHPRLFRSFHRVHHLSILPTPWTSFSFQLSEGIVEAAIVPLIILFLPMHYSVLVAFLSTMTVLGVTNHLGYEIFPQGTARHPIGRWMITATHHQTHHERYHCNYGLYFTIWDRLMGTQDPQYEARFDQVKSR